MASDSEWTTDATAPVMRLLYQSGVAISPAGIGANLDHRMDDPPPRDAVLETLTALEERELVRRLNDVEAFYVITEHGRDYVETKVDQEGVGFVD